MKFFIDTANVNEIRAANDMGVISGVTEWGLYVELDDNKCEGLVPVRDLVDDYYELDERNYCLVGRRHNNRYRLGDKVSVQVAQANLERKQLDFVLIDPHTGKPISKPLPNSARPNGKDKSKNAKKSKRRK